ncbi:energy-coupling factor transporter transmembrane component T family protein [Haladaptatus caseinilyticus]|uniref:energy-coupling factor transporter transmembrane component T family protein n=1 Tax=Haladaptatus caseinilyticus TaxID=2993314 RepID=UPI00224A70D0|nr:energy-coupling factor transporter transmembrane component T [Haladaptatus caseinilyticus]
MTLAYRATGSFAEGLDPRVKLLFQTAFAFAAFAHTTPRGLAMLSALVAAVFFWAGTPPFWVIREFRYVFPFLLGGPLFATLTLGPPWIVPGKIVAPALASYRVCLVLCVSAAYVRTTPVRESRAAIQWLVPGRAGQFLGMGVAFVFRFFPVLQSDLRAIREAMKSRLGEKRALTERMEIIGSAGLTRAFSRADTFSLALRARCFAWNPTLPLLSVSRSDVPIFCLVCVLFGWSFV